MKRFLASIHHRLRSMFVPRLDDIHIRQSVLDDLCAMSQDAHPKEMLAFFASSRGIHHGVLEIDEIQLQAYDASGDSASVLLGNLPMTTSIVGTVHSHPGGHAYPSAADLHLYSKFGFVHAIIGEPYRRKNINFFDKKGRRIVVKIV